MHEMASVLPWDVSCNLLITDTSFRTLLTGSPGSIRVVAKASVLDSLCQGVRASESYLTLLLCRWLLDEDAFVSVDSHLPA